MKKYTVKVKNRPLRVFANYADAWDFAHEHGAKVRTAEYIAGCERAVRYYVYVRPGWIEYFDDFGAASDFAIDHSVTVHEI